MRVGGGKKHGRYYIGDGLVDTASTPTLYQIRARSTANSPAIRPRVSALQLQVQELQVISYLFIVHSFCTYICFALHCNIVMNYCSTECKRNKRRTRRHWPKRGGYDKRTSRSRQPRWPRCTTTFKVFLSKWVITSQPCNSLWLLLLFLR